MPKHTYYTKEQLQEAVDNSHSFSGVIRFLGRKQAGGTQSHLKSKIEKFEIDTSHFTGQGHNKGKTSPKKLSHHQVLVKNRLNGRREHVFRLRRALLESGITYQCVDCGVKDRYNEKSITLEIDHIDNDFTNNEKSNLQFMCPNCHSQKTNLEHKKKN